MINIDLWFIVLLASNFTFLVRHHFSHKLPSLALLRLMILCEQCMDFCYETHYMVWFDNLNVIEHT
uniref:Uncharacterized protein n=1 Tax=Rhizophora mucronata TaxID=61149 RepID=A0A2P2QPV2_RHIMU